MPTECVLETPLEQARGVIGRYPDENERYIFEFDSVDYRPVHMIGVRRPLRVTWYVDGEVTKEETLRPWIGVGIGKADKVVERRPETA